QAESPGHHISGERSEAAGRYHLVRQFLPAAAAGCAEPAGVQACDFDHHARGADPAVRSGTRGRGLTAPMTEDSDDDSGHERGRPDLVDQRAIRTRTGLVVPEVRGAAVTHGTEARKAEFEGLAAAIDLDIAFSEVVRVRAVRPATFIGGGQVETIAARIEAEEVDLLLVDAAL